MDKTDVENVVTDPRRLAALQETSLLDTPAELAFDWLTRLVTRILDTPVALVSLVDKERQFFKSSIGLPEPWASRRETPLSHSFCQYVVASGEALIIDNAPKHSLVCYNQAIPDLGVKAYAGIPLTLSNGHTVGSFCVIDTQPREWTETELEILAELAQSVITEIELRLEIEARRESEAMVLREKQQADELALRVIPIGLSLASEQDFSCLLERILAEAKSFCQADAGFLYLYTGDNKLTFVCIQIDSLDLYLGGNSGREIPFPPREVYDRQSGRPNQNTVATHVFAAGQSLRIDDFTQATERFPATQQLDHALQYNFVSCLAVPLRNSMEEIVGVLMLANARQDETEKFIPFSERRQRLVEAVSLLAGAALDAYIRQQSLANKIVELRVDIDQTQREQAVAEIQQTDYYWTLRQKVREMRNGGRRLGIGDHV